MMRKYEGSKVSKEVEMEAHSIFEYYVFGTCTRYLQDALPGTLIHGRGKILHNIKKFLDNLANLNLHVTTIAARGLVSLQMELSKLNKDERLSPSHVNKLRRIMLAIRKTLGAELQRVEAFSVTPKRIDVTKLIDDVPSLFAPGIFNILPDIARYDFNEAGKCIAFERSTAAAFHSLRGTEGFLKHFYCSLIRQKRIKKFMWGPIVEDLRRRPKTKKYETLNNNLDNIRNSYRNPTQHPEMIYDIHLAQDLFNLCTEVVNRMGRILEEEEEIKKRKPKA